MAKRPTPVFDDRRAAGTGTDGQSPRERGDDPPDVGTHRAGRIAPMRSGDRERMVDGEQWAENRCARGDAATGAGPVLVPMPRRRLHHPEKELRSRCGLSRVRVLKAPASTGSGACAGAIGSRSIVRRRPPTQRRLTCRAISGSPADWRFNGAPSGYRSGASSSRAWR